MSRKKSPKVLLAQAGLVVLALLAGLAVFVAVSQDSSARQQASEAVANAPAPTPAPTKPPRTVALWVGDSFTMGVGAEGSGYSYPYLASVGMGWTEAIDAQSGSGFVADGKNNAPNNVPIPARLGDFTGKPQYVIVDGGRNDWNRDFETETAPAVRAYLDGVRAKWPEAKIVLLVPFNVRSTEASSDFVQLFAEEAERLGALVVDPVSEGWINKDAMASMIYSDDVHPNKAGHKYIAEHLVERFKALGLVPAPKQG